MDNGDDNDNFLLPPTPTNSRNSSRRNSANLPMAKPVLLPKPILSDRNTTMRLRVNFPSPDGDHLQEDLDISPLNEDGTGLRTPERKNSHLLAEGLIKAMQNSSVNYDEFDDTEKDIFPESGNPWLMRLNDQRRDSIESTRKKLSGKGPAGALKGKNPRHRRGLRETRRSTGVAMFDEMDNPVYQDDNEEVAQETRQNTLRNERPLPPQSSLVRKAFPSTAVGYPGRSEQIGNNQFVPFPEMMKPNGLPPPNDPVQAELFQALDSELNALIQGLQHTSTQ